MSKDISARVFISCGQNKTNDEVVIAKEIAQNLLNLGFDPYIAVEEQSLRGLKENIFARLEESEYFLFVDFKREKLAGPDSSSHRGSLFSHQELAVASYLDIELLAFQENGVKEDDGIMKFIQGNAIRFSDRHLLASVVAETVRKRRWSPNWKNQLHLERNRGQFTDAHIGADGQLARFFHIEVRNLHPRKTAVNCYAYLETVRNAKTDHEKHLNTIEFKWAGYTEPNANISPSSSRRFDAMLILHKEPEEVRFNVFSDSSEFIPKISGAGDYELTYSVISENFSPMRVKFRLHLETRIEKTYFEQIA